MYRPRYTPDPTRCEISLEQTMRCPNPTCRKPYHAAYLQAGRIFPECPKCRMRWWAMVLHAGPVLPQLIQIFDDEAVALFLMRTHHLPSTLEVRHVWQVPLRLHDVHAHRDASPLMMMRGLSIVPSYVGSSR